MTIHVATAETLSDRQQIYLDRAIASLADELFEDVATLRGADVSDALEHTTVIDHLPPTHRQHYTPLFVKKFLVCVLTVAWKHRSPKPHDLACVAEEMALYALFRTAEALGEFDGENVDFSECEDLFFEDMDFELLYDPSWDGFESALGAASLGYANLSFKDWFKPFRHDDHVNPYLGE